MKKFILWLVLSGLIAGGGKALADYVVKDGNGVIQTFASFISGGKEYQLHVLVDGTTPTQVAAVSASGAVKTDASATTQPVSGTVTTTPPANASSNVSQFGGSAVVTGTGTGGSGIPRVTISSDSSLAANQSTNVAQFGGTNISTGTGAGGAGIPRVTISNDSSLAANQSSNVAQFGGTNVSTGTGAGGAGIPRVTISSDSTLAAKQFQNSPGTNGFTKAPFSVLTTELNSLASAGVATSSVNGTSGKFSQTDSGNSIIGRCWVTLGAALGGTAVAGANFSVWFLTSTDGGTTFESATVSPPPRSPDMVIAIGASNYGANAVLMGAPRQYLWLETIKIVFQNNSGQAMGASGNVMTCAGQATQY